MKGPTQITDAQVVTPHGLFHGDVLVERGQIVALGKTETPQDCEIIDAKGLILFPGAIDAHTHVQLDTGIYQTPEDWESGSIAAAHGGVTTVVDFATRADGMTLAEAVRARKEEAKKSIIDYTFHVMTRTLAPEEEAELDQMVEEGATSIKLYTTYRPNYYAADDAVLWQLEAAAKRGITTLVHCESDALVSRATKALIETGKTSLAFHGMARPALAEVEAALRVISFAKEVDAPLVVAHNSLSATAKAVQAAKSEGAKVFAETTPQYLLLDDSVYQGEDAWRFILQPPLRAAHNNEGLWSALRQGAVDMVITDHCDYSATQKRATGDFTKTPGGLPGLETLLPLMISEGVLSGRLTWPKLAQVLCANPAKIYGLGPKKGGILPGADADLVLIDPKATTTIDSSTSHMRAGYSPFEGKKLKGRILMTMRRGEIIVREGDTLAKPGSGRYLARKPHQTHA